MSSETPLSGLSIKEDEEGLEEGIRQVAKQMKMVGMAIAQIAQITGLSVDDIESL